MNTYIIGGELTFTPQSPALYSNADRRQPVALALPACLCLQTLLENYGSVVSQEKLLREVWKNRGMNVSPNTLYQNISLLRKAFSQAGLAGGIITTVPRQGFTIGQEVPVTLFINNASAGSPASDEAGAVQSSAARKRGRWLAWSMTIAAAGLPALCGIALAVATGFFHHHEDVAFTELANVPQTCHVFRNPSAYSDSDYLRLMQDHAIPCRDNRFIYITDSPEVERTAVFICDSALKSTLSATHCDSWHYRDA